MGYQVPSLISLIQHRHCGACSAFLATCKTTNSAAFKFLSIGFSSAVVQRNATGSWQQVAMGDSNMIFS